MFLGVYPGENPRLTVSLALKDTEVPRVVEMDAAEALKTPSDLDSREVYTILIRLEEDQVEESEE